MSAAGVYTGVWINYGHGPIYGSTLTLLDRDGTLFIAFLALFMSFVGNQLWVILSYIFFQVRSRNSDQDGLYHQLQATLRNSVSSLSDTWKLLTLAYHWRRKSDRVMTRVSPLAICSILHCIGVGVMSIYAAPTLIRDSLVLAQGSVCGDWNTSNATDWKLTNLQSQHQQQGWKNSAGYARSCYSPEINEGYTAGCTEYIRTEKLWTNSTEECPFENKMCKGGHVLSLDTGFLNSAQDLGISSPKGDQVEYRRKMTCSPLITEGFSEGPMPAPTNASIVGPPSMWANISLTNYNYGPLTLELEMNVTNATFVYDNMFLRPSYTGDLGTPYALGISVFFPNETGSRRKEFIPYSVYWDVSTFEPVQELRKTDGVITILFLVSKACFPQPVDDPWFSTHRFVDVEPEGLYCLDEPVSPLGCVEQDQFCNPASQKCTALATRKNLDFAPLGLRGRQAKVAERLFNATSKLGIRGPIMALGSERSMTASAFSVLGMSAEQWKIELDNWFGVVVAQLQRELVQWATGPETSSGRQYIIRPTDPEVTWMCENQVVRDMRYICFSILGLGLVVSIGSVIILTGWFIDDIAQALQRPIRRGQSRALEWRFNETFQLQKAAFEANGCGIWLEDRRAVPITKSKEKFPIPVHTEDNEEANVRRAITISKSEYDKNIANDNKDASHFESTETLR